MTEQVDYFFAPASRYSYLASTQIQSLEQDTGCHVRWHVVHSPDVRRITGKDPFAGQAVSGQYELGYRETDAKAWADYYGVPFVEPPEFEFDYQLLARAAVAGQQLGAGAAFLLGLSQAVFAAGGWPVVPGLVISVARSHHLPIEDFERLLTAKAVADQLRTRAQEAVERGVFGVPTFFVAGQMFWGNDRLPLVRHVLAQSSAGGAS